MAAAAVACAGLWGCDHFFTGASRVQLLNYTPFDIVFFSVDVSEASVHAATNMLGEPLGPQRVHSVTVPVQGWYWLRAVADTGGETVERIEGPVWIGDGYVGWLWRMEGDEVRAGTEREHVFAETDLPSMVIDTWGQPIPDEPKLPAFLHIAYDDDGGSNRPLGDPEDYEGYAAIEMRGFSTQWTEKKSWTFETRNDDGEDEAAELLGMPEEEDWVLYGPYLDRSLMRNALAYDVAAATGRYSPRTRYCEVYLNNYEAETIEETYHGVYALTEKVKRDKDRVDIARLERDDVNEPRITGGYLLEMVPTWRVAPGEVTFPISGSRTVSIKYPRPERLTPMQIEWIREYVESFEDALFGPDFDDPESGYAKYIDVASFIDYALVNDLFGNHDAFLASTFMYKDRERKLCMGPVWDFNNAMGNYTFFGFERTDGWLVYASTVEGGRTWLRRLFEDPEFATQYVDRWFELRQDTFALANLFAMIDSYADELETAQARNFIRWPVLGKTLWPPFNMGPHPDSFEGEVQKLKDWIQTRVLWMDANAEGLL